MIKTLTFASAGVLLFATITAAQSLQWEGRTFIPLNVKASLVDLSGEQVLKVERDLSALPFDVKNLGKTVDEPTFVTLKDLDISDGVIEVKMLSRVKAPSPFAQAQGFIGLAYRVRGETAFESIYLRPNAGRSENQFARNHTVQYFAYPDFKFDRLRKESKGEYETYADIGLDEWITMRIEFQGRRAVLYLNNQQHPSFYRERNERGFQIWNCRSLGGHWHGRVLQGLEDSSIKLAHRRSALRVRSA